MGADDQAQLLTRITTNTDIFGGKPIVRGQRLAVEHVLHMLAVGDTVDEILDGYPFLDRNDIEACLLFGPDSRPARPADDDPQSPESRPRESGL